jgi:hypothetical protein
MQSPSQTEDQIDATPPIDDVTAGIPHYRWTTNCSSWLASAFWCTALGARTTTCGHPIAARWHRVPTVSTERRGGAIRKIQAF